MDNTYDRMFYERGDLVAGIDESGVSDIAGPLVAACVVLPKINVDHDDLRIFEVNDCKKIPEKYRKEHASVIWEIALGIGIGEVRPEEIDYLGKRRSTILAMMRAIAACQCPVTTKKVTPNFLMIDGEISLPVSIPQIPLKDGDTKSLCIASASILAKVYRDDIMHALHRTHPHYDWAKNKGSPCDKHFKGMDTHGIQVGVHRTKFWPFQPNRERRENEGMWHWRRGLWRQKTLKHILEELGEPTWTNLESLEAETELLPQNSSGSTSSKPSRPSKSRYPRGPKISTKNGQDSP